MCFKDTSATGRLCQECPEVEPQGSPQDLAVTWRACRGEAGEEAQAQLSGRLDFPRRRQGALGLGTGRNLGSSSPAAFQKHVSACGGHLRVP